MDLLSASLFGKKRKNHEQKQGNKKQKTETNKKEKKRKKSKESVSLVGIIRYLWLLTPSLFNLGFILLIKCNGLRRMSYDAFVLFSS